MSATDAIGGKVIVTTATKVKLLQKLGAFMGMKSILLQAKKNPALLSDPEFLKRAMEYLKNETNLTQQAFWQNLNEGLRLKATQYMVMQDLLDTRQTRMVSTKDSAAIFIILSGTSEVRDGVHGEEALLGPGQVFGATGLFDEVTRDRDKFTSLPGDRLINDHVITAKMNKGSYLRISLYDMCKYVLAEDDDEEAKIDKKEYSRIAEISWEELTDDDKFYVKVYLRTRNLVDKNLFAFLDAYKFIPKNARTAAFRYYNECTHGRVITLNPKDPLSVYLIIEGGIRVEVEALRGKSHGNGLTCKRKGRRPMVVKTSTMPIILFESGSLVFFREECFKVGHEEAVVEEELFPSQVEAQPSATLHQASTSSGGKTAMRRGSDTSIMSAFSITSAISTSSADPTARKKLLARARKNVKDKPKDLYRINMIFDKFTTFLMIPFSQLERILGNENMIMKSMSDGITAQLNHSNHTVHKRILALEPWFKGNISLAPPTLLSPVLFDERATLMNTVVQTPSEVGITTVGSFNKSHVAEIPDSNSSIGTQSVSMFPDDFDFNPFASSSSRRSSPPKQSKLRGLMQKIKTTPFVTEAPPSPMDGSR